MSGPKHTPGPWKVLSQDLPDMRVVVTCDMPPRLVTTAAFAGDACLIAAAPRLAAELAAWRAWAERWGRDIQTSVSVSPTTHNELVERLAATNAALREAGVE
ncbi:MAG TPA: hypothetical protein VF202_12245 [Trueperaceae bacterium]